MPVQYSINDLVIPDRMRDLLLQKKQTVAVAESVTAGHLQIAFSLADNARKFFQGGITVYNLGQKARHLRVDPILAECCNSVSEEVAAQMAKNVTDFFCSHWGIAITGYAAPVPEKNINKLFACYAIYFKNEEKVRQTIFVENSSAQHIQQFYSHTVLDHFMKILSK